MEGRVDAVVELGSIDERGAHVDGNINGGGGVLGKAGDDECVIADVGSGT